MVESEWRSLTSHPPRNRANFTSDNQDELFECAECGAEASLTDKTCPQCGRELFDPIPAEEPLVTPSMPTLQAGGADKFQSRRYPALNFVISVQSAAAWVVAGVIALVSLGVFSR